jgi:hypothetical protein
MSKDMRERERFAAYCGIFVILRGNKFFRRLGLDRDLSFHPVTELGSGGRVQEVEVQPITHLYTI